ncbi:tRNA (guanine-N(7)-)-methyltransferase non-catalytic subunit wdr4 isoform X2 [Xenopus laevis]|uniref:tRNA (Guanine-N(7)-)-methyltransferase non-catalytic subunit wdr4 isoform X2 n=1 Tax=Xenopus laevis TaxID=8355 RepID=A0A8J0UI03_XENLA|nr:tRNA (guanine-N(7)-)-methyltransferase non-catalytic subunit wdr4 isoform X2 [Xenopus laevis]
MTRCLVTTSNVTVTRRETQTREWCRTGKEMLRVGPGSLAITGGSRLLGHRVGIDCCPFHLDCSLLEKQSAAPGVVPFPRQEGSADPHVSDKILAAAFSPSGEYFALTDDNKRLVLFRTKPVWEKISVRWVSRRCTALTFSPCGNHILVADKSGDVFSFSVPRALEQGRLELGHLSMLLDVTISLDGKHIITCDRDEKIRVSCWGAPHVIMSFCLGHTEFVSQLLPLPGQEKLLLSGSGDGTLRLWEYESGKEVHSVTLRSLAHELEDQENKRFAVSRISCCSCNGIQLAVLCEGVPGIFLFSVSPEPRLTFTQYIALTHTPIDLDFDGSAFLWVLSGVGEEPLLKYKELDGQWQSVSNDEELTRLTGIIQENWGDLEGAGAPESRFVGLYKAVFDNMATYLQKKELRLESEKRKAADGQVVLASKVQKTES